MKSSRIKFKPYHQNQLMVFPPTFDEMIDQDHPVRVLNKIINEINPDPILRKYKGGGSIGYHH